MLGVSALAQGNPPEIVRNALGCLQRKNFLPGDKRLLSTAYWVDAKSYPGEKVLYLIVYERPNRSQGLVFSIFLDGSATRTVFDIQNNAEFLRTGRADADFKKEGVKFVEPPLWGIWTQEHIAAAIVRIGHEHSFDLSDEGRSPTLHSDQCASYVDPYIKQTQPK
jgi:hypothetical protein